VVLSERTSVAEQDNGGAASADVAAGAADWKDYRMVAEEGHTVVGTVKVLEGVESPQLGNRRDLLVYLPPSYGRGDRRYPVIYMHDGQNLFDRATSFGEEWEVDQTLEEASGEGLETIVVGIPNTDARLDEYGPFHEKRHDAGGNADAYLDFIVDTVKPIVDRDFRTRPEREATGVAGSSMGGLISLYAFFARPETFGFAGVMSPALWFGGRGIFAYVKERPFTPGRIYLDIGTNEGDEALNDARRMKALLEEKGYRTGRDLLFFVEMGGHHNERAWARRLRQTLQFLLGAPPRRSRPPLQYSKL
jgi:predicted alpha/beta superfamily hydrolase